MELLPGSEYDKIIDECGCEWQLVTFAGAVLGQSSKGRAGQQNLLGIEQAESRQALMLALTAIHDDSVVSQLCPASGTRSSFTYHLLQTSCQLSCLRMTSSLQTDIVLRNMPKCAYASKSCNARFKGETDGQPNLCTPNLQHA